MTVKLGFQLGTSLILFVISVRETAQLCTRRGDLGLRILVPALWLLTFAATIGIPNLLVPVLKRSVGPGWTAVAIDGAVIVTGYLFATFFLFVNPSLTAVSRSRRLATDLSLLLVVAVAWTLVLTIGSPGWHDQPPHTYAEYRHNVELLVYTLSCDVGEVGFWLFASYRAFVVLRSVRQQWAKWGLLLVAVGGATFGLGTLTVSLLIDLLHVLLPSAPPRFRTLGKIYITALVTGQTLLAVGLAFPTLADLAFAVLAAAGRHRRRLYRRRITVLWRLMTEQFPFITLPEHPVPGGRPALPEPRWPSGRLSADATERAVGEVVDGLSWLAPYYVAAGLTDQAGVMHGEHDDDDDGGAAQGISNPRSAAVVVHAALLARARDVAAGTDEARSEPPYPRLVPDIERWDEMVRWLAHLSEALTGLGTAESLKNIAS